MVIDITDPTHPTEVGHCYTPGLIQDIFVSGSYAYVAVDDSGLRIFDVSMFEGGRFRKAGHEAKSYSSVHKPKMPNPTDFKNGRKSIRIKAR